jgi:hypothetical protein
MYRGGKRNVSARGGGGGYASRGQPLAPPEHDEQQIMQMYGQGLQLKKEWAENPKAPLANHLGGGGGGATNLGQGGAAYKVVEGLVGAKKVFR